MLLMGLVFAKGKGNAGMDGRGQRVGELTQVMYQKATGGYLSLRQAVEQLREEAHTRTVKETLARYAGIPADERATLQRCLVDALTAGSDGVRRDSVERKVRMWLKDDVQKISKQGAVQLCFALKLSVQDADEMLVKLCDEGFHWRNPREIVCVFALMQGFDYQQMLELSDQLERKGLLDVRKEAEPGVYTHQVKPLIQQLTSVGDLEAFLRDEQGKLGTLHNTAYSLFMDFLNVLELPRQDDNLPDVKAISMRDILNTYLHQDFIPRVQRAAKGRDSQAEKLALSAIQRGIRENWPDEVSLSRMVHREMDVGRKVLILLFLATDGGFTDYGDDVISEQTPEDMFQDMHERINSMLMDCGFAPLDARVPFDWMILYCMCADESIFIDGRIQSFLSEIFPMTGSTAELADGD